MTSELENSDNKKNSSVDIFSSNDLSDWSNSPSFFQDCSQFSTTDFPVTFGERYRLDKKLGGGGFGEVYLAYDNSLEIMVALKLIKIKWLNDDGHRFSEYFLSEARKLALLSANLNNPLVCNIYDYGIINDQPYMTLRYFSSGDLRKKIKSKQKGQTVNPRYVAIIVKQIASVLADIHRIGIIHHDLKPANILMDQNGRPVISDFGLAKMAGRPEGASGCTPGYASPQQEYGESEHISDDIYSLGVILFELIAGEVNRYELPFPSINCFDKKTNDQFSKIITKATEEKRCDRFSTMEEFAEDLDKMVSGNDIGTSREPYFLTTISPELIRFTYVGPGSMAPSFIDIPDRLFLNVGNALKPGVIDHHQNHGGNISTTNLVINNAEFVAASVNPLRKHDDPFFIVLSENLSFDGIMAVYVALNLLTSNHLPDGAELLARYADKIDMGYSGKNKNSLYSAFILLQNLQFKTTNYDVNWKTTFIRRFLPVIEYALKEQKKHGIPISDVNAFSCPRLFSAKDKKMIVDDQKRYEAKLINPNSKPKPLKLRLNSDLGGSEIVDSLLVRDVQNQNDKDRVIFFKDWARTDSTRAPDKNGFVALSVFHSAEQGVNARCIISVRPDSNLNLRGLGALLEKAESEKRKNHFHGIDDRVTDLVSGKPKTPRTGYSNSDPWYDGRGHGFTIIDSPRDGTFLTPEEIEDILIKYGS